MLQPNFARNRTVQLDFLDFSGRSISKFPLTSKETCGSHLNFFCSTNEFGLKSYDIRKLTSTSLYEKYAFSIIVSNRAIAKRIHLQRLKGVHKAK